MIGKVLAGRYKVTAPIGEGGMSRVWRATDMNTGKTVAVKVLREEYRDDETFVRRFEREAMAASRMAHPNIAGLLDVGLEEDGTRYLVIEYVSGKTLKQFIKEGGAIKPETAAQIIMRVLAAVQHAHQNGVIHRDIKPQNILIDREGTVKVTDFGIARMANSQTMSEDTETVMGSVYYFSPEQAKGAAVDEKSDLYSVGVVLYEMLAGQVPFTGDSPVAIAMKHIQEEPEPPSSYSEAVSPALDYVVLHAMEKRPRNRYESAAEMLQDVRLAMEHPDTILAAKAEAERREREARSAQRRKQHAQRRTLWMRRVLVGVFSLILLLLTALAGYVIMERILASRVRTVEVPNVIGIKRADAINRLVEAGIDPAVAYDWYDLVPEDVVADQSVAPGTFVTEGEMVTITVCRSNFSVRVPNVANTRLADALAVLSSAGLIGEVKEYIESPAEYGLVLSQSLKAGSAANEGDTVELVVSGGSTTMPALSDMTRAQVDQALYSLDLRADFVETSVEDPGLVGKVIGQTPSAYTQVMRGTIVQVVMGKADVTLYRASIMLDLSEVPAGTTVTLVVSDSMGSESTQINRTLTEPEEVSPFTLYSETDEGTFSVYYDGELQYTEDVSFTR